MIRIARYSSPRSSVLALSVTAGVVLVLFIASFLTHLPNPKPEQIGTVSHPTTVDSNDFGGTTGGDNFEFLIKVIQP